LYSNPSPLTWYQSLIFFASATLTLASGCRPLVAAPQAATTAGRRHLRPPLRAAATQAAATPGHRPQVAAPPGPVTRFSNLCASMGTTPGDAAAALKAKLDALLKDAKEAEEKAVAARRRARAARTLLEEEQTAAALEKAVVAARQLVPGSSSGAPHTSPATSSYEETVVAGLHLQAAAVLNVCSLVNIVLDSSSTTYASWRDLMMMVHERYALLDHVDSDVAPSTDPGWRRMDSVVLN
jgi:hypothetical protein